MVIDKSIRCAIISTWDATFADHTNKASHMKTMQLTMVKPGLFLCESGELVADWTRAVSENRVKPIHGVTPSQWIANVSAFIEICLDGNGRITWSTYWGTHAEISYPLESYPSVRPDARMV